MAEVVPSVVNLSATKAPVCKSYARRFQCSQAPAGSSSTQDQTSQIPIDVSTPGGFIDTRQSYLQFDLSITNSNYCIDYQNWPTCGAECLIERLEIVSNGTPIEQIYDYGTMVNKIMELAGQSGTRYYMYHPRCDSEISQGVKFVEFGPCKPPMVDSTGAILAAQQTGNRFSQHGYRYMGYLAGTTFVVNGQAYGETNAQNLRNVYTTSYSSATISGAQEEARLYSQFGNQVMTDTNNINGWPWNIGYAVPKMDKTVSMRTQDSTYYYANTKRFPIPVSILNIKTVYNNEGYGSAGTAEKVGVNAYQAATYTSTVIMPLYSGVVGQWMPKFLPAFLTSDLLIRITWASNYKVFNVSMDPCNRYPGTHRDFVTYVGGKLYGAAFPTQNIGLGNGVAWPFPSYNNGINQAYEIGAVNSSINQDLADYLNYYYYSGLNISGVTFTANIQDVGANKTVSIVNFPMGYNQVLTVSPSNGPTPWISGESADPDSTSSSTGYLQGGIAPKHYLPPFGLYAASLRNSKCAPSNSTTNADGSTVAVNLGPVGFDSDQIYGTKLRQSEDQAWRCLYNGWNNPTYTFTNTSNPSAGNLIQTYGTNQFSDGQANTPVYSVSNLYYVIQQVILPDDITSQIVASAAAGDISISTKTIKVFQDLNMGTSSNQLINIFAKIASADSLIAMFRMDDQTASNPKRILYDSYTGVCPLGYVLYNNDSLNFIGTGNAPAVYYPPVQAGFGFTAQLKIGTNLVPYQPMRSVPEIMIEVEKLRENAFGLSEKLDYKNNIIIGPTGTNAAGKYCYDVEADGMFTTSWTDAFALDDQTIVNDAAQSLIGQNWGGVPVGQYISRNLRVPLSTFCLGFNLSSFPGSNDVAMDGYYIGPQTCALEIQGFQLCSAANTSNTGTQHNMSCTVLIPCDMRFSAQAGGNVQTFV